MSNCLKVPSGEKIFFTHTSDPHTSQVTQSQADKKQQGILKGRRWWWWFGVRYEKNPDVIKDYVLCCMCERLSTRKISEVHDDQVV